MNPIEQAVMPLKDDAIERAQQAAIEEVNTIERELAEHGGDINKAAPYPRSLGGGLRFYLARAKYNTFHAVCVADPSHGYQSNNGHNSYFVVLDQARVDRFIKSRMADAATQYDAFVQKLVAKIGEVTDAKLIGNHVWSYSTLVVTMPDGTQQAWKTQQIVNYSKHGKPFNQWPSRQMKKVPEAA